MKAHQNTLILSAEDVRTLLPMRACIDVMESTFRALAEQRATSPNRTSLSVGTRDGSMLLMPAAVRGDGTWAGTDGSDGWFGAKVLTVFPDNTSSGRNSIQGVIVLFEGTHGSPVAIVDAGAVTAIRTAAVSAVATKILARRDAARLALIGSGVQAFSHLTALAAVRPLREVRVWSPNSDRCAALARTAESELGIESKIASSAHDAVENADLVCTVTSAHTPVVRSSWIAAGTHVNAIGAHRPTERELDSETVQRARVFVDHVPAALAEAGDILIPIADASIARSHVLGDLGDLLSGHIAGRTADADVTVFKSVGIAIEDIAAAAHVFQQATTNGMGTSVRLT